MSDEGERYLGLELQGVKKRVSGMENGRATLERAVKYVTDLQESLDQKTLPKMGSDIADMEKRISTMERTAGRDMSGRMGRAESRQSEFERRIRDLEHESEGRRNG